ncbi:MAG: A24 family peptidase C-terminal domain-containing protein, partial [Candidatus Bathyarchaeia archaeon]
MAKNYIRWRRGGSLFRGLEKEGLAVKALAVVSGYKIWLEDVERSVSLYPLEHLDDTGSWQIRLFTDAGSDRDALIKKLISLKGKKDEVWVSQGLPMIMFFLIAYIAALTVGDIFTGLVCRA